MATVSALRFCIVISSNHSANRKLLDLLNVRQLPRLFGECFVRTIEAEQHLEATVRMSGHPIRLFPLRGLGTEVDVDRSVTVLLQSRRLRGTAGQLCVAYQRVSLAV